MKKIDFFEVTKLVSHREKCGYTYLKYEFLKDYGYGFYEVYMFDGLYIAVFDVVLKQDIKFEGTYTEDVLLLSYLIDGKQTINFADTNQNTIYESQESYLIYLPKVYCSVGYHKEKPLKEIRISMTDQFLKKHQLDQELDKYDFSRLINGKKEFLNPLYSKKQEILIEILNNTKKEGLLKRLFLEAKTLQLIALQLEDSIQSSSKTDTVSKKIYQTEHIISSDLSHHYSIQDLSRQIGMNDFLLKKEFKKVFGKTIFEFTSELRMQKAKDLLINTQQPIYEISESVGYKNATHFTVAFKKHEGMTPKKYRV